MVSDRVLPVMHKAAAHPQLSNGPRHVLIFFQPPYVIDHGGAGLHSLPGHPALIGIYGDGYIKIFMNQPDDGKDPLQFFLLPNRPASRACGLPSHVYDICTVKHQFLRLSESHLPVTVPASVGKGIRRCIQDAHDIGSVPYIKFFLSYNHLITPLPFGKTGLPGPPADRSTPSLPP